MRDGLWRRREALAGVAALMGAAGAPALAVARAQAVLPDALIPATSDAGAIATPPAPPPTVEELVRLELGRDEAHRMRVPVRVQGRGPFPFMVDTGADRSVVSAELAAALGLRTDGQARVNGIAGAKVTSTARVDRLDVGGVRLEPSSLPLLPREHLGGLGIVGLDALTGQRVDIDFARKIMEVRRSRGIAHAPDEVVVRGKSRFGKLILVDSTVKKTPVYVVLDSGAQNTLGNAALRSLLFERRRRAGAPDPRAMVTLQSATGQTIEGETDFMPELTLGGVRMSRVPVIYADLHTFKLYGLLNEPALMLGMDVMRAFATVSIDFARRDVGFRLPTQEGVGLILNPT